jgi:hypothetical protein
VHLLVRAAQNRSVGGGDKLFERCAKWRQAGRYSIQVPAKRGLYQRQVAKVSVRFGEVTVRRPAGADKALAAQLTLRVVDVREENPPQDPKQRVHWCLLTTHAVGSPDAAMQIVGWYKMRWLIEQVFRTMKTDGVDVETSQITTPAALLKLVTIALVAAVRVVQLVVGRNADTGQALTDVADPRDMTALRAICASLEGRTEKLKNPHDPTTLAWYHWIAARLGGWSGYTSKGYSPAGPKTIARGLKRLDAMVEGWWLANHSADVRLG